MKGKIDLRSDLYEQYFLQVDDGQLITPGHGKSRRVMEFSKTMFQAWKVI